MRLMIVAVVLAATAAMSVAQTPEPSKSMKVPDAPAAVNTAEKALTRIYG
jgi:hypothetical protein